VSVIDPPARRRKKPRAVKAKAPPPSPGAPPALPGEWRDFVGRWLESEGCRVNPAARGDWEVELSPALGRR
jgi:hypothetical protein